MMLDAKPSPNFRIGMSNRQLLRQLRVRHQMLPLRDTRRINRERGIARPRESRILLFLTIVYGAASLLHFAHNAIFLWQYPNLPVWLTAGSVVRHHSSRHFGLHRVPTRLASHGPVHSRCLRPSRICRAGSLRRRTISAHYRHEHDRHRRSRGCVGTLDWCRLCWSALPASCRSRLTLRTRGASRCIVKHRVFPTVTWTTPVATRQSDRPGSLDARGCSRRRGPRSVAGRRLVAARSCPGRWCRTERVASAGRRNRRR